MRQSETIEALAGALCEAQAEMGGAVKESDNPFFKSKYADLTSVVKAIKEPFSKHGLSYIQLPFSSEAGIGVTTRLMHSSGQWLESDYALPIAKQDPQAAGAAITYARRYALQSMAGIPTADDDAASAVLRVAEEDISGATEALNAAESLEGLQEAFKRAWMQYPNSRAELTAVKDAKKKELQE